MSRTIASPVAVPASSRGTEPSQDRQVRRRRLRRRGYLTAYGFLSPWLLGLIVITIGPMLFSLYLSFTKYDLAGTPQWIGFANYQRMFTEDPRYLRSISVTVLYSVISVPAILILSLALAVFLNRGIRALAAYRVLFYIPSLIGTSVAVSVLWLQMFGTTGMVNRILLKFGIHHGSWLGNPDTALGTLVVLSAWTFGSTMVIFLAGLRQIPETSYEAAKLDGAGPWRRFWNVTVPQLTPVIFFNGLLVVVRSFQSFTPAYVVSGGTGQPADSLLMYTVYLYERGFVDFQMGYAAAMAWILLLALAAIAGLIFFSSRYWVFYGEDA